MPPAPGRPRAGRSRPEPAAELPLRALSVFRTCGTLRSFTKAAKALRVTQAAVSHQIAQLERYLGVRLFLRSHRGAELTAEGQTYLLAVREALGHLEQASFRLRIGRASGTVVCSIATTIAMRWLVPHLRNFNLMHPDITVQFSLTERFVDFSAENVDIAIRYGAGHWDGLVADLLFREVLVPVCSPELLRGPRPLLRFEQLREHTLLHASSGLKDWDQWLAAHRIAGVDTKRGLVFDQPHLALQAAAAGLGIAMADQSLVQSELASGRLVKPFDSGLARSEGYYVVGKAAARDSLHVGTFWRWLLAQVAEAPGTGHSTAAEADR